MDGILWRGSKSLFTPARSKVLVPPRGMVQECGVYRVKGFDPQLVRVDVDLTNNQNFISLVLWMGQKTPRFAS